MLTADFDSAIEAMGWRYVPGKGRGGGSLRADSVEGGPSGRLAGLHEAIQALKSFSGLYRPPDKCTTIAEEEPYWDFCTFLGRVKGKHTRPLTY